MTAAVASTTTPTTAVANTSASGATAGTGNSTAITSTGIGSGLNISAIVSALTSSFGAGQQNQITSQQNSLDAQVSAFGTLTSSLDSLQATLSALETPSTLGGYDAKVADSTIASATAGADAVPGSYTLEVDSLATAASLTSINPVVGATTGVGTGTLNISVGSNSAAITVDSSNNTLSGIAAAINGAANNPGVTASVITASDGQRLVLTGTATGTGNAISVTQSGGDGGLAALVYDPANSHLTPGLAQTTAAADASFKINGYAATSSSNIVKGVISGVTLNLLGVSAIGATTSVSVSPDTTAANTAITAFVTALNSSLSTLESLTAYDPSTQTAGALQGNASVQSLQNQLADILDTITSGNSGVNSLADLGITADANTGAYDTSNSTLGNVLSSSLSAVGNLLGGTNGVATKIDTLLASYTGAGGILSTINDGLESGLSNLNQQQTQLNAELATYSATLTTQYNAMDAAVASLKETQTYLTAEFNPNASSSSATSSLSSGTTSS